MLGILLGVLPFTLSMPLQAQPHRVIGVYDADSTQGSSIRMAIRGWNRSGAGIRFRLVDSPADATVVVRGFRHEGDLQRWCRPLRTVNPFPIKENMAACVDWQGYKPFRKIRMAVFDKEAGGTEPSVIAHELGHVAGLGHTDERTHDCSIMLASIITRHGCFAERAPVEIVVEACVPGAINRLLHCRIERRYNEVCGPSRSDVEAIRRMYGTAEPRRRWDPWCSRTESLYAYGMLHDASIAVEAVRDDWEGRAGRMLARMARIDPYNAQRYCAAALRSDIGPVVYERSAPPALERACDVERLVHRVPRAWMLAAIEGVHPDM